jgi:hypothetical protein
MTGDYVGTRTPSPTRKASTEPPGIDRVAGAFTRSARWYVAIGVLTVAAALTLLAGAFTGFGGESARTVFLSAAGSVLVLAVLPFIQAFRRRKRVAFLASMRGRWAYLARAGDPEDQIAPLRRAYAGLVGNDLRTRMAASP